MRRTWGSRTTALTAADVRDIRAAFQAGEWVSRLAQKYLLSRQAIYDIVYFRSHRDVEGAA